MADIYIDIASSGGDYTTLKAALQAEVSSGNNAAGNTYYFQGAAFNDASGYMSIGSSWLVDAIYIEAASGAKHSGTRGTGYRISATGGYNGGIDVTRSNVYFRGVAFNGGDYSSTYGIYASGANIRAEKCLFFDMAQTGIIVAGSSTVVRCSNCAFFGCGNGILTQNQGTVYAYNNDFLNCTYGLNNQAYCIVYAKNNYGGGGTTVYYNQSNGTWYSTTNASADGSQSSTTVTLANSGLTSYTDGSEDIELTSDANLGGGTDLSGDSAYAISVDMFDTARDSSPCRGCYEYSSGGTNYYIPAKYAYYRTMGVM